MPWLINAAQLDKFRKSQKSLVILDATKHAPGDNRDAKQEFIENHIIGALFFDIEDFNDKHASQPHGNMVIQDEKIINEKLGALGIRNDYKIILYDNSKLHTACRALWMLKYFGHPPELLYILDGGIEAWLQYQGKTQSGETLPASRTYQAKLQPTYLRTLTQMKANLNNPHEQVVDVRHAVRFAGGPESRPGLRAGHIPGSFCFPYSSLFDADGRFRTADKIRQLLISIGLDLKKPIITSCGSGTTAPIFNFALDLLEHTQHGMYNGSWTEWGAEKLHANESDLSERPVETSLED